MSMSNYRNDRQRPGGGGGQPQQQPYQSSKQLPVDAPIKFYRDAEKTKLDPEIFSNRAEKDAEKFGTEKFDDKVKELTSAQLRRFFGEMKGYYQRWRNQGKSEEAFDILLPLVKMMKSKVYYAVNLNKPKQSKIPHSFASFLLGGIEQIKDSKDFEAFILYFEAVVGFLYGKALVR